MRPLLVALIAVELLANLFIIIPNEREKSRICSFFIYDYNYKNTTYQNWKQQGLPDELFFRNNDGYFLFRLHHAFFHAPDYENRMTRLFRAIYFVTTLTLLFYRARYIQSPDSILPILTNGYIVVFGAVVIVTSFLGDIDWTKTF